MATSSERSPPPFPDSEDQDVLDNEDVQRDSDEDDLFMSAISPPPTEMDPQLPAVLQPSEMSVNPLIDPLVDTADIRTEIKPAIDLLGEPSDEFVDLTNNVTGSPDDLASAVNSVAEAAKTTSEISLEESSDEFVDLTGSEGEAPRGGAVLADVTFEAAPDTSEVTGDDKAVSEAVQEAEEPPAAPVIDVFGGLSANVQEPQGGNKILDPLVNLLSEAPPAADAKKPSKAAAADLFEDDGSDLFTEPRQAKSVKQPQKSLFGDPAEDLFGEPLGAASKKTISKEQKNKIATPKASGDVGNISGPLKSSNPTEPADIFAEEGVTTAPSIRTTGAVGSKTNGVHSQEDTDLFTEATVELSLDSPHNVRKKDVGEKPSASASASSLSAATSLTPSPSATLEELEEEEEEEEELEDKFDISVSVKDPEKIGDGMNAYMAYKVTTQTTLQMFRHKTFTVRRRFSDFLGLYEKLSEKHGPNGFIVPPPPEKSILGMTKVKVGKEDSSSADFVERRRGALERYLQRVVDHPSLLQDPDVREFLEREDLPRAVSTQALSGAGFLKMINKATDAVSKMTIKMNESDVWFEEKLQEVESTDQYFRKLHALVESLVVHRKELSLNTSSFAKSTAMLGSAEDNTALSRALSQLAEVEDKMEQLHQDQAANDTFGFAEVIADYIRLLGAVRGSFDQRMKTWQRWQDAQTVLQKKRETEAKLLWANKPDKLQLAKEEIVEWEAKVTQYERDFERVSATVRKEVIRFEKEKTKNFKSQIIKYLESLLQSQHQLIKYWEAFLPEAKAIA
ncbi:sorting nexin-1a [Takifugu flavidus]|uniref:Sorting nexin-1 n=1 Tax=Takifugu flavidus TaxID=433684 RepID=A0A5C6P7W8_9TELE|nr:sorting nexin-1a [Takifugu flavidus]TWW75772.1 Sorting nexin-1 [Takifugu flavidus]